MMEEEPNNVVSVYEEKEKENNHDNNSDDANKYNHDDNDDVHNNNDDNNDDNDNNNDDNNDNNDNDEEKTNEETPNEEKPDEEKPNQEKPNEEKRYKVPCVEDLPTILGYIENEKDKQSKITNKKMEELLSKYPDDMDLSPQNNTVQQGGKPCNQFDDCLDKIYIIPKGFSNIYKNIARSITYYQTEIGKKINRLKKDKFNSFQITELEEKIEKMNELNTLYTAEDLTIVLNDDTRDDYYSLFGNNNCHVYYKVPLPFCLTIIQINQLFQEMYLNNFILFQQIIEKYNKFDYKIIGESNLINNVIYIYFEQEKQKIPINKSKLYDISLPNDFEIDKITISGSMYKYKLYDPSKLYVTDVETPLNNINGEKIDLSKQSITKLSTTYKLENKDVLIENYYYSSKEECSIGSKTSFRNQLYLLKNYVKEENIKNIENYILLDNFFPETCVKIIWEQYKTEYLKTNQVNLDDVNEYYESKSETTNEILVLLKRKINPRRFISLLLYISRIYYEKDASHWLGTLYNVIQNKLTLQYYLNDRNEKNIIIIQLALIYMFSTYNVYYSKDFYKKTINGEYISLIKTGNLKGGGLNDLMNSVVGLNDKYDFTEDIQKNITHYTDFVTGKSKEPINKKVYKWVTCPFIDNCEPDVIQFIDNYVKDDSINNDLLNMDSRKNICENIGEIQDKIDSVFSELKFILPKNYFDSDKYMENYLKKAEQINNT
jgi:hypothetical protein